MIKKITVTSIKDIEIVKNILAQYFENTGDTDVELKPHKSDLSAEQRKLYWKWISIISDELWGGDKDLLHDHLKEKYLLSIYVREDINGYAELAQNMRVLKAEGHKLFYSLRKHAVNELSIMDLNTAQMYEYMKCIELFAADHSIRLPFPDDLKMEDLLK